MFSTWIFETIINIIATLIIIWILQELWSYLLDNFSKKRTKDLVNGQLEKYKKVMGEANKTQGFISEEEKQDLNQDLQNFMKSEL